MMKYIVFLLFFFSVNVTAANEIPVMEEETPVHEESYRDTLPYKWHRRGKRAEREKKEELNDAQIFERQMLERKRQNYKPRATNKRVSGRSKANNYKPATRKKSASAFRSRSAPSGASRGLPSLGTGMFVK